MQKQQSPPPPTTNNHNHNHSPLLLTDTGFTSRRRRRRRFPLHIVVGILIVVFIVVAVLTFVQSNNGGGRLKNNNDNNKIRKVYHVHVNNEEEGNAVAAGKYPARIKKKKKRRKQHQNTDCDNNHCHQQQPPISATPPCSPPCPPPPITSPPPTVPVVDDVRPPNATSEICNGEWISLFSVRHRRSVQRMQNGSIVGVPCQTPSETASSGVDNLYRVEYPVASQPSFYLVSALSQKRLRVRNGVIVHDSDLTSDELLFSVVRNIDDACATRPTAGVECLLFAQSAAAQIERTFVSINFQLQGEGEHGKSRVLGLDNGAPEIFAAYKLIRTV